MKLRHLLSRSLTARLVLSLTLSAFIAMAVLASPVAYGDTQTGPGQDSPSADRPASQSYGINPSKGPPGSRITISGTGFRGFAQVESITMGGLDILGNRTVTTDRDGFFEVTDLLVPGLDPGIVGVVIRVGTGPQETTAVGTFEITPPGDAPGGSSSAAQALAPLGDALERVFHFDNATKTWSFFDPRPEFAGANTLTQLVEGQVYWVKVARSISVSLNSQQRQLSCANEGTPQEDCWNLLVW